MITQKHIMLAALAGTAVFAQAQYTSPEMMMVVDDGGSINGNTIAPRVERYDPYTGAYLGSFGTGYLMNPSGITIYGQNAYVSDQFTYDGAAYSRIDEFNFSTGAYEGSIFNSEPYNLFGLGTYGSNIVASDFGYGGSGGAIWSWTSTGTLNGSYSLPGTPYAEDIATDSNGHDYVASAFGGLFIYNAGSNGLPTSLVSQVGTTTGYVGVATTSALPGTVFAGGATSVGELDEYNSAGGLLSDYQTGSSMYYYSLAFGHNGMLYALTSSQTIQRFDGTTSLNYGPIGSFALGDTAHGIRMAVYAAPEPVSTSLLVLGTAGFLIRRRHRV